MNAKIRKLTKPDPSKPKLSCREIQILTLIALGLTYQEISGRLNISYETVRSYLKRLRKKLDLRQKSQLAVWTLSNLDWLTKLQKGC